MYRISIEVFFNVYTVVMTTFDNFISFYSYIIEESQLLLNALSSYRKENTFVYDCFIMNTAHTAM